MKRMAFGQISQLHPDKFSQIFQVRIKWVPPVLLVLAFPAIISTVVTGFVFLMNNQQSSGMCTPLRYTVHPISLLVITLTPDWSFVSIYRTERAL